MGNTNKRKAKRENIPIIEPVKLHYDSIEIEESLRQLIELQKMMSKYSDTFDKENATKIAIAEINIRNYSNG